MSLFYLRRVQRWLGRHLLCRVPAAGPRFALTFDDGPSSRNTPRLLDVLDHHGARATFFVMAGRVAPHAALVRRMRDAGHEIGIHGHLHLPAWGLPRFWLERDLERAIASVRDVTGTDPRYYRAPFGLLWPSQARWMRDRGLVAVLGDIYPRDHAERRARPIADHVLSRLGAGAIVILHDSSALGEADRSATLEAVDLILAAASSRGLRAATIGQLVASSGQPQRAGAGEPEPPRAATEPETRPGTRP